MSEVKEGFVYKISDEGLETFKSEIWFLENIEKIGIVIGKEQPYLIIEHKHAIVVDGKPTYEFKLTTIK